VKKKQVRFYISKDSLVFRKQTIIIKDFDMNRNMESKFTSNTPLYTRLALLCRSNVSRSLTRYLVNFKMCNQNIVPTIDILSNSSIGVFSSFDFSSFLLAKTEGCVNTNTIYIDEDVYIDSVCTRFHLLVAIGMAYRHSSGYYAPRPK